MTATVRERRYCFPFQQFQRDLTRLQVPQEEGRTTI